MLHISGINKTYSQGSTRQYVIKNLSVSFPDVGFFSILGKSGSGKTTLLNILGGIDSFDSGEITLSGLNYTSLSSSDWNKIHANIISFVFQEYNLIDQFTVIENLQFALPNVDNQLIDETLDKFELLEKKDKYPNQLSGGEKQRIAIIRSLLKESRMILVDEPTGNLDEETSLVVVRFLKELTKGKLVIMVTHDTAIAQQYSDQVLLMKQGRLCENIESFSKSQQISLDGLSSLGFSSRRAWRLSLQQMKKKLSKYIQYVLIFSITLFFLSMAFALLFVNEFSVAAHNLIDTNTQYYEYTPIYVNNADEQYFFSQLHSSTYKLYQAYQVSLEEVGNSSNNSYLSIISGYMAYHDRVEITQGRAPSNDNEIVVSDYFAKALVNDSENISSIDDILGYKIPNTNMIVSGLYKTDYEQYQNVLNLEGNFLYNHDIDPSIESILQYKVSEVYSIVYTSTDFNFSNTNSSVKGFLPDYSSETTNADIRITTLSNMNNYTYSIFNEDLIGPNDCYISKSVLSIIIQRDTNYNITSATEFNDYWNNHEQELVEYVISKEMNLSQVLKNKDIIYPFDTVVIRGVYTADDQVVKTIQVPNSLYNEVFTHDYVIALTNNNANELQEDMVTLYNRNYEYNGFNLSAIIHFKEETRPVITSLAIGLSIILSVFTILVFTNLLSRDISNMHSEIGLLRSLGIPMKSISKLYIFEVLIIGFSAILVMMILHPLGLQTLNNIWSSGYRDLIIVSFNIKSLLLCLFALFIILSITIILPLIKLSRLKLIDCIKTNN